MSRITITTADQLIDFIKETNLTFKDYLKICRTFTKSSLWWFTGTENKEDIIQFLTTYKDPINNSLEVPVYIDKDVINNADIGRRYFYSNYYINS